ncbi:MAG: tetratricopeptide repeat protein [Bacteroidia bacterium]
MKALKHFFLLSFLLITTLVAHAKSASDQLLENGWQELIRDSDTKALNLFGRAYEEAITEKDTFNIATALYRMGICTYSVSYADGMDYALRSMKEYEKFSKSSPEKALLGRARCLQLISTIKGRQGNYSEAINMTTTAIPLLEQTGDSNNLGVAYNSLGKAYHETGRNDSSEFFYRKALTLFTEIKDSVYLPVSMKFVGDLEAENGNKDKSLELYTSALNIAGATGNRQALADVNLGLGNWQLKFSSDKKSSWNYFQSALTIASGLTDRTYYIKVLESIKNYHIQVGDFKSAYQTSESILKTRDSLTKWEQEKIQKSLEVRFDVAEKERQLKQAQEERAVSQWVNYLLWSSLAFLLIIGATIIYFIRRNHNRDKLLLKTKEELLVTKEEQKKLREQHLQNEIEYKESQLAAMTLQMVRKNELLQELQEQIQSDQNVTRDNPLMKTIGKARNEEKEWADFNAQFESVNRNFYAKLKSAYPDISPNDLKICALIKLNLSIKEMAAILNISPDSVKTARYRLRKKLQLNTEDNLTEFILSLQ